MVLFENRNCQLTQASCMWHRKPTTIFWTRASGHQKPATIFWIWAIIETQKLFFPNFVQVLYSIMLCCQWTLNPSRKFSRKEKSRFPNGG